WARGRAPPRRGSAVAVRDRSVAAVGPVADGPAERDEPPHVVDRDVLLGGRAAPTVDVERAHPGRAAPPGRPTPRPAEHGVAVVIRLIPAVTPLSTASRVVLAGAGAERRGEPGPAQRRAE